MLDKNKRETEISMDYSILVRKVFSLCISYEVLYLPSVFQVLYLQEMSLLSYAYLEIKWMGNHGYLHSSDQQTPLFIGKS